MNSFIFLEERKKEKHRNRGVSKKGENKEYLGGAIVKEALDYCNIHNANL